MRDIATALQELKWVETRIDEAQDLESLRSLYQRVQTVRRSFPDDFDLQLSVADLQERLIDRGRRLRENPDEGRREPARPEGTKGIWSDTTAPRPTADARGPTPGRHQTNRFGLSSS